jgi:hypothetical protein
MSHSRDKDERPERITERRPEPDERVHDLNQERAPQPWWIQAGENARRRQAERQQHDLPGADPECMADRAGYDRELAIEAERLPLTEREQRLLHTLGPEQEHSREQIETLIHSRRIAALRERDDQRLARDLSPMLNQQQRQALADYMAEHDAFRREQEYPVPGPNQELLSPRERDIAEDRMLEEYQRKERERER